MSTGPLRNRLARLLTLPREREREREILPDDDKLLFARLFHIGGKRRR